MDRKKYLEKCKAACMDYTDDDSLKVMFNGIKCYPYAYQLSFNPNGEPLHTAVLIDNGTLMYARLADVKEV